ncbi:MAG: hypothetical protein DSZ28_02415 [Thiothrix sp.]|nr:MAG: hypothetical protein DSZ28_02415 [Thiothrix sp.]
MEKYQLNLSESDDESRQKTLDELTGFVRQMKTDALTVITLDEEQSTNWDQEGGFDYQDYYGQEIINQLAGEENDSLVIRNAKCLPVALSIRFDNAGWQGIGVDVRLRKEVEVLLQINEAELE